MTDGKAAEKSNKKVAGMSCVMALCKAASSTSTTLAKMDLPGRKPRCWGEIHLEKRGSQFPAMAEAVGKNAISSVHNAEGSGPLGCVHIAMLTVMVDRLLRETDVYPQIDRVWFMR